MEIKTSFKFIYLFFLIGLVLVLPACTPTSRQINGDEQNQVLTYAEPLEDNLMAGLQQNDYAMYSKDFEMQMATASTEKSFESLRTLLNTKLGAYKSRKVAKVEEVQQYIRVTYQMEYEKSKSVVMRLVLTKDTHLIAGTWWDAPELR